MSTFNPLNPKYAIHVIVIVRKKASFDDTYA